MQNETMINFGYPRTMIAETRHWSIQLRAKQPTLGSLVMICREDVQAFAAISPDAFGEMREVVTRTEAMLKAFVDYDRLNYLMLMMVDPNVHFHVIPRYRGSRDHAGTSFPDHGWPGPPGLGQAVTLRQEAADGIRERLSTLWNGS